jgi:hypothetical protein
VVDAPIATALAEQRRRLALRRLPRCADCLQHIDGDGNGHVDWCPFTGGYEFPTVDGKSCGPFQVRNKRQ